MSRKKKDLIRRIVYNAKTDTAEVRFYDGRKKATDAQVKKEIKEKWATLSPDELSKKDRQYLARVKGGHKRQSEAVRIDGKFVNKSFFNNPDNPVQWQDIAERRGFTGPNAIQQLFNNDQEVYQSARKDYYSEQGLHFKYTSDSIQNYIDTFGGKIFIAHTDEEGQETTKEVTKLKALVTVDNIDKAIKRKFGSFFNEYNIQYKHGYTELHISIPTKKQIDFSESPEELEEYGVEVGYEQTEEAILERQITKWEQSEKEVDPDRYNYEYKVKEKISKGKYRTKIKTETARSIVEAKVKIKAANKDAILIKVDRKAKGKPKKKK